MRFLFFLSLPVMLTAFAKAAWRTESFDLQPGWNGIYNFVDASHVPLEELLETHAEITEVWRWQPERNDARLVDPTLTPASGIEWAVWKRDSPGDSTFNRLRPNFAYLVRVADDADPFTLAVKGRAILPQIRWRSDGLNLIGMPVGKSSEPLLASYFESFGLAVGRNGILDYVGGPIEDGQNPTSRNPSTTRIERGNAYWINAEKFSRLYGPIEIEIDQGSRIDFGTEDYSATLTLTNHDRETRMVTLSSESSEPAPDGQPEFAGALPLFMRVGFKAELTSLDSPFSVAIPAGETRKVEIRLDRLALGGAPGDVLGNLLKIQTGAELVYLPAVAERTSFAGLWVGAARINRVASVLKRYRRDANGDTIFDDEGNPEIIEDLTTPQSSDQLPGTGRPYDLRLIVHVDNSGAVTLLSHVYQGTLANPPADQLVGLTLEESALDPAELDKAARLSVAHLPLDTAADLGNAFGPGALLGTTLETPHDSPVNPFVHSYHPDHDNLDARFDEALPPGIESFDISRAISLDFDLIRPTGIDDAWGSTLFTGTYSEDIDGIHKDTLRSQGSFALRKISPIGSLSSP